MGYILYPLPPPLENHMSSSAETFETEGLYPSLFFWSSSTLDTITDSLMLLEASDDTDDSAINKALLAYHGFISDYGSIETLVNHYINGTEYDGRSTYARYWHGYHIFLKPLLELMDYQSIRILNGIVQLMLVALVVYLLIRREMKEYVIPYLISYLMLMPIALAKSLQFSTCYYVMTFAMIAILLLNNKVKNKYIYLLFLNVGIATSYFDFLTYPIAAFGVPAVVFLLIHPDYDIEKRLSALVKSFFCWGVGYVGMWSLKWIIASLVTEENVILDALNTVLTRTSDKSVSGDTIQYMRLQCEGMNIIEFVRTPFVLFMAVFIIITVKRIAGRKDLTRDMICRHLIPYILVALLPFLWYAFAANHSFIHYWFTNKACVVSALSIMCGLAELNRISHQPR